MKVCISLCTKNRPAMLAQCLDSLVPAVANAGVATEVVVVENSEAEQCRGVVESFADRLSVHYFREPEPGIPFARNRGVEECLKLGCDWLIFIDDDEFVAEDWLHALVVATRQYDAEVLSGPRIRLYPEDTPQWVRHIILTYNPPSGTERITTYTANTIAAARLFQSDGLGMRFDERLRYTGGSDDEFFMRFSALGGKIVWVREARVFEEVPESRATLGWHAQRYARMANTRVLVAHLQGGMWRALGYAPPLIAERALFGSARVLYGLVLLAVDRPAARRRFCRAAMNFASAYGFLLGLLNISLNPYRRRIDGR